MMNGRKGGGGIDAVTDYISVSPFFDSFFKMKLVTIVNVYFVINDIHKFKIILMRLYFPIQMKISSLKVVICDISLLVPRMTESCSIKHRKSTFGESYDQENKTKQTFT